MPGYTPVLGIPYPLIGETVTATDFANFASAINSIVITNQSQVSAALVRKNAFVVETFNQSITQAVETTINFSTTTFSDNDGMFSTGTPDRLTIQTAGIYHVLMYGWRLSTFTTLFSMRSLVYQNSVAKFGERHNETSGSSSPAVGSSGMLVCNVGDIIQVKVLWTGTGGPAQMSAGILFIRRVCPLS